MMKRILICLLACLLLTPCMAHASLERSPVLDAAFSLLEEGNIFQVRYNQLTGAEVQSILPYGVPYFYGGTKASMVFVNAPEYAAIKSWTSSPLYYKADQQYVMGFDCAGFTHWLCQTAGLQDHDKIRTMLGEPYHKKGRHLFCDQKDNTPSLGKVAQFLLPGDFMVAGYGSSGYHIMCFVGTLRDYGFTAAEVPELAAYLDYPLVVHCSAHPAFGERFETVIHSNRERYGRCQTTDGGVAVSLLCEDVNIAPNSGVMQRQEHHWFNLDEGRLMLNVIDVSHYDQFAWMRMGEAK